MARILQIRRGTTASNDKFTGMPGELSFDTEKNVLRVHDGVTMGGYALARIDQVSADGAAAFDINTVPDEFWEAKFSQFTGSGGGDSTGINIMTSAIDIPFSVTPYIEYLFDTTSTPLWASVIFICKTADAGYSPGDQVSSFGFGEHIAPAPNITSDASGVWVRMMVGSAAAWVAHKNTGVRTSITAGAWNMRFRLYC